MFVCLSGPADGGFKVVTVCSDLLNLVGVFLVDDFFKCFSVIRDIASCSKTLFINYNLQAGWKVKLNQVLKLMTKLIFVYEIALKFYFGHLQIFSICFDSER